MILQYSVKNYKVFKEKATISFIASNYDKTTRENENIQFIADKNLRVLRSAVVYGANAAGKTKLFESLVFFKRLVINSSKEGQQGQGIDVQPFLLSEATEHEPSEFEIVFLYNGAMYRYGFEVTKDKVLSEWLFYKPRAYEFQVFYRDAVEGTVESHSTYFKKGAMLHKENLVRPNALMLSVAAQFNDKICTDVLNWFMKKCKIISSIREDGYKGYTMRRINQQDCHEKMLNLIKFADFAIQDISSKTLSEEDITDEMSAEMREFLRDKILNEKAEIYTKSETTHHKYDASNKIIGNTTFSMDEDESHGTQKYFYLSGPILDTLESGGILFVDEFDARLHPNLVLKLFSLFNDQKLNKQGSQLIITSQNSVFLRSELLRKDQLWFVEKDRFEAAHLYSLSDFKAQKVRANENFETNYLKGKYGAIPYLNHLDSYEELVCEKEK
ncbi:MAG TPA: ATP-binding protein [Sphaerochaeta sp.]|nr:ATP-binding protein [Sphaerochaeta sp.]